MIPSRYKIYFGFVFMLLCFIAGGHDAVAQNILDVRASQKSDYSRLVLDGKKSSSYSINRNGGNLTISFQSAFQPNVADLSNIQNIGGVSVLSQSGENLKLSVSIPSDSKFRDFKIGNRIIIDVYNGTGKPASIQATPQKNKEQDKETAKAPPASELDSVAPKTDDNIEADIQNKPHVITISTTKNVGLAVFERSGYLWIVQDDPSIKVPPAISGTHKDELPALEDVSMATGKAYRMRKPKGAHFYVEGGGLLWRIVMTPTPRGKDPLDFETREVSEANIVKRSAFWPIDTARKVLTVKDPSIGDNITVVTAEDSAKTVGPGRDMVDMKILPSIVGLAIVPNVEKLSVVVESNKGVSVSKEGGLAISPLNDTEPLTLANDIEKEKELFERLDNPNDMSRIYDFGSWEMGGENALIENRRVLMVATGSKKGASKVENLITMAKLNLANDKGPEALGLLRVAEQELPGIEETPEFVALRGAALVLSSKYDEAIEQLMTNSIQPFNEINYWKSAALAGLEDWQQADKVMPLNFDVLASYPKQIKEPITLNLTEVALRAGKVNVAESLLSLLEEEFDSMTLPRRSAWKYLQGEMERQSGNDEQALKNWEPLLTGKDDYYRAKAGLSVTRLQLEREKITPAKAIDRLEGLRYAWRGDELETLINYRLGQVYIDDKNYLKGLSVLRNAVGLSPGSKISKEVADYMTEVFRNLFTDGTLDTLSPLDAVSIYDEFKELTPAGKDGDVFVQNLAERLVKVDLLGRADSLLEDQMKYRLKGADKVKVAIRLAAIRLLNEKPNEALEILDVASAEPGAVKFNNEIRMLRARALSKNGESNKALSLLRGLPKTENLAKLRADIAWSGGLWNDAANAFQDLIRYANISKTKPMDEYQENLVLNRAIALNLSGNRTALENLRNEYEQLILQSNKARIFNLVTRPRQLGLLADRESVTSFISEVDLFSQFLENYKSAQ